MDQSKALLKFSEDNAWQKLCTNILMDSLKMPEHQRAPAWAEARKELTKQARRKIVDPKHQRIIIADAKLENLSLRDFDFSYCYITRTILRGADLRDSKFNYAIIREGTLKDARAEGASFDLTDIKNTVVENLRFDYRTKLNLARFEPSGLVSPHLQDRINQHRLAASNRNAPILYKVLNFLTGYGFGIGRLLLACAVVILGFAVTYRLVDVQEFAIGAGPGKPESLNFWNFLLFSIERFINASPWINGVSNLTHFLSVFESLVGLFILGLLIAMLIRQVVRSG